MEPPIAPITLCGKLFIPELIEHLNELLSENPAMSNTKLARVACEHLGWFSAKATPCLSGAKVALHKLRRRGLLTSKQAVADPVSKPRRRLRHSGQELPALEKVPAKAGRVKGLCLHLISGKDDPLHSIWNDLIIEQHPCGDAPLAGAQMRYLVGSEHGWLGALGFSSAAFVLKARDCWIGWSKASRTSNLGQVVCLSRFLIRLEVRCANLASKVLSMAASAMTMDWEKRYGLSPLLLETFVDRERYTGLCFKAANWQRIGASTGRGRLGPETPAKSIKDIWVYPLCARARETLQEETPMPVPARGLEHWLGAQDWCTQELAGLELGDRRLRLRAQAILQARWEQPQSSFYGSFDNWAAAKGAYGFIEHRKAPLSMATLLGAHSEATLSRMAAEPLVLLPQDTSSLNYSGLKKTTGLGPLGEKKGRGMWLHSTLACRPDGVPLGVLDAHCWARPEETNNTAARGRNAKSIDQKESLRWLEELQNAAAAARRMPQTQVVVMADREGDLYELHDAVGLGPPNLHTLIRAQHDRNLEGHHKLWKFMASVECGGTRTIEVPRRRGQGARKATVEIRFSPVTIRAPKAGVKKDWPSLQLWALQVHETDPPEGMEAIDWMLLSDLPIADAQQAWEMVEWYRCRWGIEEWHRVIKTGCHAERREFKSAEHLMRVLVFDLIVAWRILACVKLGRALPQLPASTLYTPDELEVLCAAQKKTPVTHRTDARPSQPPRRTPGRLCGSPS